LGTPVKKEAEEERKKFGEFDMRRDGGGEELASDPAVENAAEKGCCAQIKRRESWTPTREGRRGTC